MAIMTTFGFEQIFHNEKQLILLIILISHCIISHGQQQAPVAMDSTNVKFIVPNLPLDHYQFWLKNHPRTLQEFELICSKEPRPLHINDLNKFQLLHVNLTFEDPRYLDNLEYGRSILSRICTSIDAIPKSCWGYESTCQNIYLMPECNGPSLGQAKDEQEQKITWFTQADFGYILHRRREMNRFCSPPKYTNDSIKSSLECTKYFRTCRGDNLFLKFNSISRNSESVTYGGQYLMEKGDIGGWNCDLQLKRIKEEEGHKGALSSWFDDLKNYNLIENPNEKCDVTIEKQAFIIKLDSSSNMYHYFCNFLNLYATFHLNNKFSEDIELIIWDNKLPRSNYEAMWSVFSKNKPRSVGEFEGKRVCFKKFIFALLPRMIDGLYYNTPLIPGCSKSGLFDAFNKFVLHKLNIPQAHDLAYYRRSENKIIRVTLVIRSTPHRRILNLDAVKQAIEKKSNLYQVQVVDYKDLKFLDQLNTSQNTDILVGVHGAGLTHTLFLPNWAALFEVNDCADKCYHELARLRGVDYFTIIDKQNFVKKVPIEDELELKQLEKAKLVNDEKFSNYEIDVEEFMKVLEVAAKKVLKNRSEFYQNIEKDSEDSIDKKTSATTERNAPEIKKSSNHHTEL